MATLQIENLPDELYRAIQTLATDKNLSLNEAVIQVLTQAVQPTNADQHYKKEQIKRQQPEQMQRSGAALARIRNRPRLNPIEFGLAGSTQMIREDRDR